MENSENKNKNLFTLIAELVREVFSLIRQHYELLKEEFKENALRVVKSILLLIFALVIAYAGLIFLGILTVYLLSMIIPQWVALLLVTGIYLAIPLIMITYAIHLIGMVLKEPQKIIAELKKTGKDGEKWLDDLNK